MYLGKTDIRYKEEYNTLILKCKCMYLTQLCMCVRAQSCPSLCDSVDCSPPRSSLHGLFQARILEWVAMSVFNIVTLVNIFYKGIFKMSSSSSSFCTAFMDVWD